MKAIFGGLITLLAFAAAAQAQQVTVEHMTCARAQIYVQKYGQYWKDVGADGSVLISPVYTLQKIKCSGKQFVQAQTEATSDNPDCVVGYYCLSYKFLIGNPRQ